MTATRLRLRAAAAVWRQTAVCEPDLDAVLASPDEVAGWGAGLPIEVDELARAAIGARSFVLIAAPRIGVAWLAAEALQAGEPSGRTLLTTPTTAYGVQTRCDWRGTAAEPDASRTVWQLAGELDERWLAIRRLVRGALVGPLCCVSADEVVERWSADASDDADAADLAEPSAPEPAAGRSATEALLAFLGRGPAEAEAEAEASRTVTPVSGATDEPITRHVAADSGALEPSGAESLAAPDADDANAAGAPRGTHDVEAVGSPADVRSPSSDHAVPGPAQRSSVAPQSHGARELPRSIVTPGATPGATPDTISDAQPAAASPSRTGDDASHAAPTSSAGDRTRSALVDATAHAGANAIAGPSPARTSSDAAGAPDAASASRAADAPRAASDAAHARSRAMPVAEQAAPASQAADDGSLAHARSNASQGVPSAADVAASPAVASPEMNLHSSRAYRPGTSADPGTHAALPVAALSALDIRGELRTSSAPHTTAGTPTASSRTGPERRDASDARSASSPTSDAALRRGPGAPTRAHVGEPGMPASEPAPRSRIAIARRHGDDLGLPAVPPMSRSSVAPAGPGDGSAAPPAGPRFANRDDARRPLAHAAPSSTQLAHTAPPHAQLAQAAPSSTQLPHAAPSSTPPAHATPPNAQLSATAPRSAQLAPASPPKAQLGDAAPLSAPPAHATPPNAQLAHAASSTAQLARGASSTAQLAHAGPPGAQLAPGTPPSARVAHAAPQSARVAHAAPPGTQLASGTPPSAQLAPGVPPSAQLAHTARSSAPVAHAASSTAQLARDASSTAQLAHAGPPGAQLAPGTPPSTQLAHAGPPVPTVPVAAATVPSATARCPGEAAPAMRKARPPAAPAASLDDIPVATPVDTSATPIHLPGHPARHRTAHREVRVGDIAVELGDALPPRASVERPGALTAAIPHRGGAFDHTAAPRHSLLPRRRP